MTGREGGTIGERLASRRRRHFVGRRAEVDLFRSALATGDFGLLHVSGPGGAGKTTLLDAWAEDATDAGRCVVRLDGHDLPSTPAGVLDALEDQLDVPASGAAITPGPAGMLVLLVDGYEELAVLDAWFREHLLTRLPDSTVIVLSGRAPPGLEWRADPAWSERMRVITLRNLATSDARDYLERRGVPTARHRDVVEATFGHPLALSLMADVLVRDPEVEVPSMPHDVVRALLHRVVGDVSPAQHREALEAVTIARVTDEELLRHVLSGAVGAREAFAWLEELSFLEGRTDGLSPHDLVRDLLDADLRRRDGESYRRVFRAVQDHVLGRVRTTTGESQVRAITDLKFCFRHLRSATAPVAWESWGAHYPDRCTPADHPDVVALVRAAEGEQSGDVVAHWLRRQPGAFHVVRGPAGRLRGVLTLLDLTAATAADRDADPGARAVWDHVARTAPPRAGETVTQCRFVVDAECYQAPSPTLNAVPILTLQRQLATRHLAWDFVTLADPDGWEAFFRNADMTRAVGSDFTSGGRCFGSFGHDFRRVPVEAMVRRWTERALADDSFLVPPDEAPQPLVLAHADFDAAVRQALRDLHRPDLLGRNALLRSRLLADVEGEPDAPRLAAVLCSAVAALRRDPGDDKLFRAVDATFVQRARTQEAAAAALDLPFSTYRRHLARGLDRVVERLWHRELGTGPDDEPTG